MNVSTRPATVSDSRVVYELICELENFDFPEETFQELFLANLHEQRIAYIVAELDNTVVAFGSVYINSLLHHCGKVAEIQELIVSRCHRNRNIGRCLLTSLLDWARQQDALQVEVTSSIKRVDALGFYQSNGFALTHNKLVLHI